MTGSALGVDGVKRRLLSVAGFAAFGGGFALLYHQLGVGVPCPMLMLTGWWCPFCGATRMAAAVLDGDLVAAFHWNPAAFILVAVLGLLTVAWVIEWVTRRPPPWRRLVKRWSFRQWFIVACVVMFGWMIARNVGRILIG